MARLTIPDEATSADFTVTTEQSVFPFSFAIFEKADLRVTANGLNVAQSEFTFAGTRLEGGGYKGGVVTLNTPAQAGTVRVWRRIKPVRPSNFASQTSVPVRSVDMELNKVVAQQQDVMLALEDVEAGVVDPDVLAEVVEGATQGKADSTGGNLDAAQAQSFGETLGVYAIPVERLGAQAGIPLFDNTDPINNAEAAAALLGVGVTFRDGGQYYYKGTLVGARNGLNWRGYRSRLIYNGTSTTRNLVEFGDNVSEYREMDVDGLEICSLTVMTAGCAVWAPLACRSNFRFDNIQGQDFAEANGNNLWNGFWADKVDNIEVHSDNINAQNEGVIVNGAISGPKADCWLDIGKISGGNVGVHMAGGFGGLYITPDTTMIHNKVNLLVDRAITAEGNRELFATGAIFDVAEGDDLENDANIIISDDGGLRLNFTGCWISAGASHAFWVKALQGILCISGCRIIQHLGDGFRTSVAGSGFTLITGCQITGMGGWGINGLVNGYAVAYGACEIGANTLGNINTTYTNASRTTGGSATFLGGVRAGYDNVGGFVRDDQNYWILTGGNPTFNVDIGDYYSFDRANNVHGWFLGNQSTFSIKPEYIKAMGGDYYSPAARKTGTADGSGIALATHSDANLPRKIKNVQGFYYAADGSSWSLPGAANITTSYISFQAHAPAAGRPFVIDYEYYESAW